MTTRRRTAYGSAPQNRNSIRAARKVHSNPRPQARGDNGDDFSELFGVEPFLRNQITGKQIHLLQNMIDSDGLPKASETVGVCPQTLLYLCAGFGHRLTTASAAKVREFFAGARS